MSDGLWAPRGRVARSLVLGGLGVNLAASLAMALILSDATAAGGGPEHRIAFIASHRTVVSAGWYLWILAGLGLVVVIFTVVRSLPASDGLGRLILLLLTLGVVPDIVSNLIGAAVLPELAHRYNEAPPEMRGAILLDFQSWDRFSVLLTGAVGNFFYGLAGWTLLYATHRTPDFPRSLVWLAVPLWSATLGIAAAAVADSVTALVGTVAAAMSLFSLWCAGVAFMFLGKPAPRG